MPRKLYEVPFEFKVKGVLLAHVNTPEEAIELAKEQLSCDPSNLQEGCVFFDESEATVKYIKTVGPDGEDTEKPVLGAAVESDENPDEYGFEDEEAA